MLGILTMLVIIVRNAVENLYVRNVNIPRKITASYANCVMTVVISLRNKSVSVNSNHHMFVMDAVTILSAHLQNLIIMLVMLIKYSLRTYRNHVVAF